MKLLTFYIRHGDCKVALRETGSSGVLELELACDEHGVLDKFGPDRYAKYSAAKKAGMRAGEKHLGLDKATWLMLR